MGREGVQSRGETKRRTDGLDGGREKGLQEGVEPRSSEGGGLEEDEKIKKEITLVEF